MNEVNLRLSEIKWLCKQFNVRTLFVFGSATTNNLKKDSDIDMIVDIDQSDPLLYSDMYFELKENLQKLLHRPIDLLEQRAIKNRYLKAEIDQTKVLVYAQ